MGTHYNAQIDDKNKIYSIQFETDSYEKFKNVEKICQSVIDNIPAVGNEKEGSYWIKEVDGGNYERYTCSNCKHTYWGLPRSPFCPNCNALMLGERVLI